MLGSGEEVSLCILRTEDNFKNCTWIFVTALFIVAEKWDKRDVLPLMTGSTKCGSSIIDRYSATKNGTLLHAIIWRNLEYTLKERSQSWNNICHFVPFLGNVQTGKALGTREISDRQLRRQRAVTAVCTGFLAVLERIPKQLAVVVVHLSGDTNHCWTLHVKRAKFMGCKVHINLNVLLRFLKTGVITAWSSFESFRI